MSTSPGRSGTRSGGPDYLDGLRRGTGRRTALYGGNLSRAQAVYSDDTCRSKCGSLCRSNRCADGRNDVVYDGQSMHRVREAHHQCRNREGRL